MIYHLTLVRMRIIKKNLQTINAGEGMEEREDPSYIAGGNVNWYMENRMEGPWRAESGATI